MADCRAKPPPCPPPEYRGRVKTESRARFLVCGVEPPARLEVARQFLAGEVGSDQLDGDGVLAQHGIVELSLRHAAGDQLRMERAELQAAEQVCRLVERRIRAVDAPANFGGGVAAFVANALDEEVDRLLGRHLPEMEFEREDDAVQRCARQKSIPTRSSGVRGNAMSHIFISQYNAQPST